MGKGEKIEWNDEEQCRFLWFCAAKPLSPQAAWAWWTDCVVQTFLACAAVSRV